MLRITHFMRELVEPTPHVPQRRPTGPVVIWNLVRRCNLTCKHCYSISADKDFPGELDFKTVCRVMDDLRHFGVPVLILSGGEPLLRPDIFDIARRAKEMGFYVALSSNGTLIDENNIGAFETTGFDYVGISIDGMRETHDTFRRKRGAFNDALRGIRLCRERGVKVGLRFTMTEDNATDLPALLQLMKKEGVEKFYFSHLNYAGRGNRNRESDAFFDTTRRAMELLFQQALEDVQAGIGTEFVSGNNDADGVYLLHWVARRFPAQVEHLHRKLVQWGGNSSGVNVANIDNLGNVHPDTMWWHHTLGNVRERPFSEIWMDTRDPIMAGLKAFPRKINGRCSRCRYFDICGGNTRIRALQLTGDPWAEDPGCYLTDREIGLPQTHPEELNRSPVTQ